MSLPGKGSTVKSNGSNLSAQRVRRDCAVLVYLSSLSAPIKAFWSVRIENCLPSN